MATGDDQLLSLRSAAWTWRAGGGKGEKGGKKRNGEGRERKCGKGREEPRARKQDQKKRRGYKGSEAGIFAEREGRG